MRRSIALLATAAALVATTAAIAAPKDVDKGPRFTNLEKRYLKVYPKAREAFGYETVGRNIVRTGFTNERVATQKQIGESLERMQSWLNPPEPAPAATAAAPAATADQTGYSSGGVPGELEAIAQCESGGDYGAVNPTSGAYGKYQILPSTSAAYGCDMATPAGQDACAVEIYAGGAGRGQWVC